LVRWYRARVVQRVSGRGGNFRVALAKNGAPAQELSAGAIIAATGFEHFDASRDPRYEYGRAANVIGIHELEGMLKEGRVVCKDGRLPKRIAFVFCVGSRDRATNPWGCTVCCGGGLKPGLQRKRLPKDRESYNIYIDAATVGP